MKKLLGLLALLLGAAPVYADTCSVNLMPAFAPHQATRLCATFVGTSTISGALTFTTQGPLIQATKLAISVGAATTPNYTFDNAKLLGPSTMNLAASTAVAIAPASGNTPIAKFQSLGLFSQLNQWLVAAPTAIALSAGAANTPNSTFDNSGLTFATAGMGENLPAGQVLTPATDLTPVAGARLLQNRLSSVATAAPTLAVVFAQPTASVGKVLRFYNQGANPVLILPEDGQVNASAALTPFICAAGKICTGTGFSTTKMLWGAQ
jgi:hypothetical protein